MLAFIIILILGIAAIITAIAREQPFSSTFLYLTAFWFALVAHLYPGHF